jgi:hypothetical protein
MPQPRIEIAGSGAQEIANELHAILQEEFGPTPAPLAAAPPHAATRDASKVDPYVVATFVLAIPVAIDSTLKLADRLRLKEKWDRVLAKLRGKLARSPNTRVTLIVDRRVIRLEQSQSGEIIDLMVECKTTVRKGR